MNKGAAGRIVVLAALAQLATGCDAPPESPTPALLKGAQAGGGWWNNGCPPASTIDRQMQASGQEAISPELTARLERRYPPGSSEAVLRNDLRALGFGEFEHCPNEPTISNAAFRQRGGGMTSYPMFAVVAWRAEQGRVEWIKASVAYTGP